MTWLVVGLGNPGDEYASSRHNIGFMAVDAMVKRWGGRMGDFRSKFGSELLQLDFRSDKVHVQKPMEYMNVSGGPVQRMMAFYRVEPSHLIVIHDDIDLEFGRVKVKQGGGHGGHNGLRSITGAIGADYLRIRGGVGRPGGDAAKRDRVVNYVLGSFARSEQAALTEELERMVDAVELIIDKGILQAMNQFNGS